MVEDIIAIVEAVAPIVIALIGAWRFFVWRDGKSQDARNAIAMEEKKRLSEEMRMQREAAQSQAFTLKQILQNSETTMEVLVGVINTFTDASAKRDLAHEQEMKRHNEVLELLNKTMERGLSESANNLQSLKDVVSIFGNNIIAVENNTKPIQAIQEQTEKTAKAVGDLDTTFTTVRYELNTIQKSLQELVTSNGNLVTTAKIVEVQALFDKKIDAILDLLKQCERQPTKDKKDKDNDTQPIAISDL